MSSHRRLPAAVAILLATAVLLGGGEAAASDPAYSSAIAQSRAAFAAMQARSNTPGVTVAVAVDGRIVWNEAFGLADVELEVPATPATRFGIGSVSKALTTAVFARLVERGRLSWDAPIRKYLPQFPGGEAITPRMLAGHTSGLDDTFGAAHRETLQQFSAERLLQEAMREPRRHPPGADFFYATGTYNVLAAIIEKVEGAPFREVMSRELLRPFGLNDTLPNDQRVLVRNRSSMYELEDSGLRKVHSDSTFKLAGAGFLSTAADVARFGSALLQGKVVGAQQFSELLRPVKTTAGNQPTTGTSALLGMKDIGVGLGWTLAQDDRGRRVIHQPGGGAGISAWLVMYPEQKLVIAVLSNRGSAPVGGQAFRATAAAFLDSLAAPPR